MAAWAAVACTVFAAAGAGTAPAHRLWPRAAPAVALHAPNSRAAVITATAGTPAATSSTLARDPGSAFDWSGLDAAYLITCDPDGERMRLAREILRAFDLEDVVQVRVFAPDPADKVRGCYTSHMAVLKEAAEALEGHDSFCVLVLEDNLGASAASARPIMRDVLAQVFGEAVRGAVGAWDMIHLAYITYVPGLAIERVVASGNGQPLKHLRRLRVTNPQSSLGTTAYLISKEGAEKILARDRAEGYTASIPEVMADLFPESRLAAFPMVFHRSAKVKSIVNPQMDSLRSIVFQPAVTGAIERILGTTGLKTSVFFPALAAAVILVFLLSTAQTVVAVWELATVPGDIDPGKAAAAVLAAAVSSASVALLAQGAALAPKPPPAAKQ